MIRYRVDILEELKKKGYNSNKIRQEKLLGQRYLQQLRHGEPISWAALDIVCGLLQCQPGDLLEWVDEDAALCEKLLEEYNADPDKGTFVPFEDACKELGVK